MCEGIERWSAVFQDDEPRIQSSYTKLGDTAIHPNELLNIVTPNIKIVKLTMLRLPIHARSTAIIR